MSIFEMNRIEFKHPVKFVKYPIKYPSRYYQPSTLQSLFSYFPVESHPFVCLCICICALDSLTKNPMRIQYSSQAGR